MSNAAVMRSMHRGFAQEEFEHRVSRAQVLMSRQGIDALLLMTEAEVRYFSGFQTQFWHSPTRPWFLVLQLTGKPIAVVPDIGASVIARGYIDRVVSWQSPHPTDDGVGQLATVLQEAAGKSGVIGVPMGAESTIRMPLRDFDALRAGLSQQFVDATPLIKELRLIKSEAEIGKISRAAEIASNAFDKASELFYVEQPMVDAFRAFKIECLKQGADDIVYLAGGAGPGGYDDIISMPTTRPLATGDVLMLDTGVMFDGYFCDFDRNFCFGPPDESVVHAYATLWEATQAGMAEARPGVRCQEVFATMHNVISRAGYHAGSGVGRYGHGLGMQLTEWPSMATFDHTELVQNMVITLEPSLVMANGRTMVHEENVVVRKRGVELLSRRASPEIICLPG
ncbi:MAG: Xaa-Pro peptidase family protein [Burkholderiaceae bacterium]